MKTRVGLKVIMLFNSLSFIVTFLIYLLNFADNSIGLMNRNRRQKEAPFMSQVPFVLLFITPFPLKA